MQARRRIFATRSESPALRFGSIRPSRGGDAWDTSIRRQIKACALFMPIISANAHARTEGYFRFEWKLAVDRSHLMSPDQAFLFPVVIDDTGHLDERIPERFRELQWTRLPDGQATPAFVARIRGLLDGDVAAEPSPQARPAGLSAHAPQAQPGSHDAGTTQPATRSLRSTAIIVVLVLVFVGAAYVAVDRLLLSKRGNATSTAMAEKSIAVLPFVDMSEKKDQEYFADGMAEEILNLLVKVPELKVIGRTSSFQFKGQMEDLRKIGTVLGATYVVEGSVRRSGDHIRVTAQLIDSRDGTHRWSETYDREASDTLKVQDEIATSLVRALQLEVAPSNDLLSRSSPRNGEAYDVYLRGLHAVDRLDEGGFNEAIADFRHALEIDPSFVPAAEALAWALFGLADTQYVSPQTGYENTRAAAEAALKLDPKSAHAHTILCLVHIEYDWDWPAAEQEAKKALALAPNTPGVLTCAAEYAIAMGRWADALGFIDAAIAADPLSSNIYRLRGYSCLRLIRYTEAESAFRRAHEISPTNVWGHYFVAMAMLPQGNAEAALTEMQKESDAAGRDGGLVVVYQTLHRPDDAERAFGRPKAEGTERWPFGLAFASAVRGDTDQAFSWLEKAYAGRDPSLWAIKGHPYLRSLERDPRYKAFLQKMNLPE
jgi:TolB-like protein/tetratricopeptide (TPR) repeat protein